MLDNLINSLDDSSDTEPIAMSKQIDISSNDIPNPRNSASSLKEKRDLL